LNVPESELAADCSFFAALRRDFLTSDLGFGSAYGHTGDFILRHLQHLKPNKVEILDSSSSTASA
jgi:hypothetical protein